jgi:hypothetical protein
LDLRSTQRLQQTRDISSSLSKGERPDPQTLKTNLPLSIPDEAIPLAVKRDALKQRIYDIKNDPDTVLRERQDRSFWQKVKETVKHGGNSRDHEQRYLEKQVAKLEEKILRAKNPEAYVEKRVNQVNHALTESFPFLNDAPQPSNSNSNSNSNGRVDTPIVDAPKPTVGETLNKGGQKPLSVKEKVQELEKSGHTVRSQTGIDTSNKPQAPKTGQSVKL